MQPTQPIVVQPVQRDPVRLQCPYCLEDIITLTEYHPGVCTYLSSVGLCVIGCPFGCCLIPFCLNDLKDVVHRCPSCSHVVATYKKI
ncbi:lipopolysaccharide-induced tumor necrosis factor-alpha factor [Paragonimus westermani]|uniref:Lipopolysaccharide-induced tumor necrosis factor-alpha factor n=1 Tax=Paragonimus westermani TaxID=34504 RepID=A0A5J4NME3_9TREM|nr:lipopolysaccharide-induced tumor necrosis factor-alpha factor [Paragonimus westermani]